MKTYKKLFTICLVVAVSLLLIDSANAVTLSQTNVSLSAGQSLTVSASNYSTTLYLSSNSNSSVASVSVSGSTINIYALTSGSTTATICESNISNCSSIYITVNGNNNYNTGNFGLNISSLVLPVGSYTTISSSSNNNYVYGYYNNNTGLYVSSNSNPNVASTSSSSIVPGCYGTNQYSVVTGQPCNTTTSYNNNNNSIVISALSAGSDTISLCQSNGGSCSSINITVTNYSAPLNSSYNYNYSTPVNSYSSYYDYSAPTNSLSGIPIVYSTSTAY